MRVNEYETFEQFYEEYNYDRNIFEEHYSGLDFLYKSKYYRLGHDYCNSDKEHKYKYIAYEIIQKDNAEYFNGEYKVVGQFISLDDMLENWLFDDLKFRDVIMDNDTKILGKD